LTQVNYSDSNRSENLDTVADEVLKYLKMNNNPEPRDPLAWWESVGKEMFPSIYVVAMKYLILPGTSVPSERVFSAAGNIITKKQSVLGDKMAADLIFLRENFTKKQKK
jgi:hypothetical protein